MLMEISLKSNIIGTRDDYDDKSIIQVIYEYCPNLRYLKLYVGKDNILDLKDLLINCQYLNGLFIIPEVGDDWDKLFEILAKFSPTSLFKYKFKLTIHLFCT